MADIVNKVMKILLITLLFDLQLTFVRLQVQQEDDLYSALSDLLAEGDEINQSSSSRDRYGNKRSIETETDQIKPQIRYGRKHTGKDEAVLRTSHGRDARPRIAYVPSPDVLQSSKHRFPTISPEAEVPSLPLTGAPVDTPAPDLPKPNFAPEEKSLNKGGDDSSDVTNIDPCEPNPCQNGGTCRREKGEPDAFQCACSLEFRGKYCHEVMAKCEVIGCRDVSDCISTPSGAVCLCKGKETGRLCKLDVINQTEWEKVKMVVSERTVHTGEIIVGSVLGVLVLLVILLAIHCHRVNSRRAVVRKRYKEVLDKGIVPSEPPPDWCEISSDVIKQTLCCQKGSSLVDDYMPRKSLSRIQSSTKQREDELVRLLNSRTSMPRIGELENRRQSYSLLNEVDEALQSTAEPQVSPEQIDFEINRRTSSYRGIGPNGIGMKNQSINNRPSGTFDSRTTIPESRVSSRRELFEAKIANSRGSVHSKHSQLQSNQNNSTRRSMQQTYLLKRQRVGADKIRIKESGCFSDNLPLRNKDDSDDNEDCHTSEPEYGSSLRYNNNSTRYAFTDSSHNANVKRYNYFVTRRKSRDLGLNKRERLAKKMHDIKENLETLKTCISKRNNGRKVLANTPRMKSGSKYLPRHREFRNARYTGQNMHGEFEEGFSSSDEKLTEIDGKLMMTINMKNKSVDAPNTDFYSTRTRNLNKNTNYEYRDFDEVGKYCVNLNDYEHSEHPISSRENPDIVSENINHNKIVENDCKQYRSTSFDGYLFDSSRQRDRMGNTHWYRNREQEDSILNTDQDNVDNQTYESVKEESRNEDQYPESPYSCDINTYNLHNVAAAKHDEDPQFGCDTSTPVKNEGLNIRNARQPDATKNIQVASEKENGFRLIGSEYYGVLATNISDPRKDFSSQLTDHDRFTAREFMRKIDNSCQGYEYVNREVESYSFHDDFIRCMTQEDSQASQEGNQTSKDFTKLHTRKEHTDMENKKSENILSTELEGSHILNRSPALENTPSTIVGTANSTTVSMGNQENATLMAETSHASDTEMEM